MSQIINITSEALQATIRRLLPSQQGFGEDLQASNVITPIIDLTPTAEGSILPDYLQQAYTLSNTSFNVSNSSTTVTATAGFHIVQYISAVTNQGASVDNTLSVTNGLSTVILMDHDEIGSSTGADRNITGQFVVFLDSGQSLVATSTAATGRITGTSRQIATITGELVDPPGFVSQ
jgi:hypothetical protein